MKLIESNIIKDSFIWSFGTKPPFDSGLQGNYNTPIYCKAGDILILCSTFYITTVTGGAGANFQINDSGGNAIMNCYGANAVGTWNTPIAIAAIKTSGILVLNINGNDFTGGILRFDFQIFRTY